MDFDELEDEIESRLQAGEEVAGYVVQNNQPRPGNVLPLMKRSNRLPGLHMLPDAQRRKIPPLNGEKPVERRPVLRLLCVHGVADSLSQEWFYLEEEAPPDIEVAVHEFPGHGHREREPICGDLQELADDAFEAFREAMDSGTFALLGHSIGCLVITRVAKRARAELGVEPVCVFMVERGACQFPLFTEEGYKRLRDEPLPFMAIYQPAVVSFYRSAGAIGQRTLDMWQKGWFCENETMEPGYHTFDCPLKAIFAEHMVRCEEKFEDLDPYKRTIIEDGSKFFNKATEGMAFTGHFPLHTFEAWVDWTEFKESFRVVECKACDHMSIKASKSFKAAVFESLREIVRLWSAGA